MTWWQLLITTLGPIITAGLTTYFAHKGNIKIIEKEQSFIRENEQKQIEIKKAEDLFQILKPFLSNRTFLNYFHQQKGNIKTFEDYMYLYYQDYEWNDNDKYSFRTTIENICRNSRFPSETKENCKIIKDLIFQTMIKEQDLENFLLLYGQEPNKEKINQDINKINDLLGKNIPLIK